MSRNRLFEKSVAGMLMGGILLGLILPVTVYAAENVKNGGGYAITGQLQNVGYTTELYDAQNGLPTSDANCVLASRDGYIWVGGYGGILKYDGVSFERLDSSGGLTNGRAFYEDTEGRIWVGTNDSGVVVLENNTSHHITYRDGLPSSSIRSFGQETDGTMWVGTASGLGFVDQDYKVHAVTDGRLVIPKRVPSLPSGITGSQSSTQRKNLESRESILFIRIL